MDPISQICDGIYLAARYQIQMMLLHIQYRKTLLNKASSPKDRRNLENVFEKMGSPIGIYEKCPIYRKKENVEII